MSLGSAGRLCVLLICAISMMVPVQNAAGADLSGKDVAARVGTGSVMLDQIFEQWGPAWYEVIGKAMAGTIQPSEVDAQLQQAWDKAMDAAVKDEVFYQEAVRDFDQQFTKLVDSYMASSGGREMSEEGSSRKQVEARLRRLIDKNRDQQVGEILERSIKAAGGIDNLIRTLRSRGLTYDIWKSRVVRKAYTYGYLFSVFEPMGDKVQPSPSKVLTYYKSHPDKFTEQGKVVFKQIFFDNATRGGEDGAYKAASAVYGAIADGKLGFDDAVAKYSDDKISKAQGGLEDGDSSDPERETWLAEVRDAAREQAPGKLGPVLISPRGCHIVMLVRADKGRLVPYARAQKLILDKMESDKWEKRSAEFFAKLRQEVLIEIVYKQFPARYAWANIQGKAMPRRIGAGAAQMYDAEASVDSGAPVIAPAGQ